MYKQSRNLKDEILEILARNKTMNIKEISETLGVSRITAEKYLGILEAEKKIEHEFFGIAKLYSVK